MPSALLGTCSFEGDVYAVGGPFTRSTLYHWTGRRWLQRGSMLAGQRLWACWAGPKGVIIAVGQDGTILRRDAEGWHRDTLPPGSESADLYGVWGMDNGTAVAVGGGLAGASETSVALHFDGTRWRRLSTTAIHSKTLRAVWGSGPRDYWAVGDNGAIGHYDGTDWRQPPSGAFDRLYGVFGSGPRDVYAVGGTGRGVILRWNGSAWSQFDEGDHALRSAWTAPGRPLFVGGDSGYVARYGRGNGLPGNTLPELRRFTETAPFPHLRINSLVGLGSTMLGAASTMKVSDDTGDWRGAIVSRGRSFSGPIYESPDPDAGDTGDAGPSLTH